MNIQKLADQVLDKVPSKLKHTSYVRYFGFTKVPMIFWLRPIVEELNDKKCVVKIPLTRRSKNHLNSMYFAAIAAGGDIACGIHAMYLIHKSKEKISFVFKDFHAEFLKRPEDDAIFVCEEGEAISKLVKEVENSDDRKNLTVRVNVYCPKKCGDEVMAKLQLTLSLKKK